MNLTRHQKLSRLFFIVSFFYAQTPNATYASRAVCFVRTTIATLAASDSGKAKTLAANTAIISADPDSAPRAINAVVTTHDGATAAKDVLSSLPSFSYMGPNTYMVGTRIEPLAVNGSGVTPNGFSANPVSLNPGGSGVNGVAADAGGNVYMVTSGNNSIMKVPAGGGRAIVFASGFNFPSDVAVDAAGNVYVADAGSGSVMEVLAGTSTPIVIATGLGFPAALALDAANNIYVADGNSRIAKITAEGHAVNTVAAGFNGPFGVAVDGNGNIYVTDFTNSLFEIPATGGQRITIGTGFNNNNGVRVDGAGNIYVADSGNGVVKVFTPGSKTPATLTYQMSIPLGMALDHNGALYVSDSDAGMVYKFNPAGGYYISPNLPAGLNFDGNTGLISGTPTAVSPATTYNITGYNARGGTAATVNIAVTSPPLPAISYTGPNVYNTGVAIAPLTPKNDGGLVAANSYSNNPVAINAAFGLRNRGGLAVDAGGNIYVADNVVRAIKEIPFGGGAPITLGSGFRNPTDVALDTAGNIYVADAGSGAIKKIPAGNGTPVVIASGLSHPAAIALDAAGNIFVADDNKSILKIPAGGGTPVAVATGFNRPFGVTVDAAGNIYVTDANNSLYKIPASGGSIITLNSSLNNPKHVKVNPSGNIYVADSDNGLVKIFPPGGGAPAAVNFGGFPFGIAIDGSGNLFVSGEGANSIFKFMPVGGYYISPALPLGLSFDTTTGIISGTPTAASPATTYTITGYNAAGGSATTVNIRVIANAALSSLALSSGTLSPAFAKATTAYGASVTNEVTSIAVTPTTIDPAATVTVNGSAVTSGTTSQSIPLNFGLNIITTTVTAQDGQTTKTYTTNVTRVPSNNAQLASITTLPATSLLVTAGPGNLNFMAAVPNAISSIQVVPTAKDATAGITVNGQPVTSGTASAAIALPVGPTVITTALTAQDGVTTNTVVITITRAASTNASLAGLAMSSGTLSPVFTPTTAGYTASVADTVSSVTLTPIASDSTSMVTVNGIAVGSGTASQAISLNFGTTTITTVVTAQDGKTTKKYTINVTRTASNNASPASMATFPATSLLSAPGAGYLNFTAAVPNNINSIQVIPTAKDATATITVNGQPVTSGTASQIIDLPVGQTVITTVITAQDGTTTRSAIITVTRAPSNNATLAGLALSSGTLSSAFATNATGYSAMVTNTTTSISITPTTSDPAATVTVNGAAITSGIASQTIALNTGANTITTVVTAPDGKTTKTYTLTVTRPASANALPASIATTPTTSLLTTTGDGYLNFTAAVPNSVSSIQVIPAAKDTAATITVNGIPVMSGSASQPIALPVGQTVITTVITAQDSVTTKTINITVTRAPSGDANLSNIALSSGTLTPVFVPAIASYKTTVNGITNVILTPTTADPTATVTVNGAVTTSGAGVPVALITGANTVTTVVTAQDGKTTKSYTTTVILAPNDDAQIATIATSPAISLSGTTGAGYLNFKSSVENSITSIQEIVTTKDPLATMTVNGTPVTPGGLSQNIPLAVGQNTITTVITAQDGVTRKSVTLTITRAPSDNADLSDLTLSNGTLAPAFVSSINNYKAAVNYIDRVTITPTTSDPNATLTVNGAAVISGTPVPVRLVNGINTITTVITAQDGVTSKTYTVNLTRVPSNDASPDSIVTLPATQLLATSGTGYLNFITNVPDSFSSIQVVPTANDATATIAVNGQPVISGAASQAITLPLGSTVITVVITAQDSITTKLITITVNRAAFPPGYARYQQGVSVTAPTEQLSLDDHDIAVHGAISPNGDNINDYLTIDGITSYPDNKLTIVDHNGIMVYQVQGYNNSSIKFDGHSSSGKMQLPGTYFYTLDYKVKGENKHKAGYFVMKY